MKPGEGDRWVLEAIAAESRLWMAHHIGSRDAEDWTKLWGNVQEVLDPRARLPLFATDAWDPAQLGLEQTFGVWQPVPYPGRGRPPNPVLVLPKGFLYVQVAKHREGSRVVLVERRIVHGDPMRIQRILERTGTTINTSFIERANLTTRTWNHRFVRKGIGFSKNDACLEWSVELTKVRVNFLRDHPSLRKRKPGRPRKRGGPYRHRTPAMAAGITDHRWSWMEILRWRPPT